MSGPAPPARPAKKAAERPGSMLGRILASVTAQPAQAAVAVTQPQADDDGATPPEAQPARSPSSASEAPEAGSRALAEEVDDENANWRFLTSEDEIRAADVPEEMRIRIAHDEPNLFTAVACDPDSTS